MVVGLIVSDEALRDEGEEGRFCEASLVILSAVEMDGEGGVVVGGVSAMGAIVVVWMNVEEQLGRLDVSWSHEEAASSTKSSNVKCRWA